MQTRQLAPAAFSNVLRKAVRLPECGEETAPGWLMKAAIHTGRVVVVSVPCPWQLSPWSGSEAGSLCSEHDFPVCTLSSTLWATFPKLTSV